MNNRHDRYLRHPVTGRALGGRFTTGRYETREQLEEEIQASLLNNPEMSWKALGIRHGVSPSTARNITISLIENGRISPVSG